MKKFEEYLKERYIVDDMEEIVSVVHDYLADKADELEREAPYAETEIRRLNEAAYTVFCIRND